MLEDTDPVGWWWPFDEDISEGDPEAVEKTMQPIPISMLTSSSTSFFDLADSFARRRYPFVFVIDGTEITGTVSYLDLFSYIGQACIFALTLHLEAIAEELCSLRSQECWKTLSPARQEMAQEVLKKRYSQLKWLSGRPFDEQLPLLIKSTTFADKGTMLAKTGLVEGSSKTKFKSIFGMAERIRNLCAQGASEQEFVSALPQKTFAKFLHRTQDTIETLRLAVNDLTTQ